MGLLISNNFSSCSGSLNANSFRSNIVFIVFESSVNRIFFNKYQVSDASEDTGSSIFQNGYFFHISKLFKVTLNWLFWMNLSNTFKENFPVFFFCLFIIDFFTVESPFQINKHELWSVLITSEIMRSVYNSLSICLWMDIHKYNSPRKAFSIMQQMNSRWFDNSLKVPGQLIRLNIKRDVFAKYSQLLLTRATHILLKLRICLL